MTETLIQVKDLNSYYGASHILRNVNFDVKRGETIGLMGRNGMGKSTLLKSIMGIVKPRSGEVHIKGKRMNDCAIFEVAQQGIAYVPEGRGIFANLSVVENLKMAARPGTQGQNDWTYDRVLDTFPRLKERLGHGGQQLSGGEQQMLTLCRTLMGDPDLIIIDEPTEGLAPKIVELVGQYLQNLKSRGISVLLIEQKLTIAMRISDRALVMGHGSIVFQGTPDELRDNTYIRKEWLEV